MCEKAYLVRVNLAQLARNLKSRNGEEYDELSAARWLTQCGGSYTTPAGETAYEHSPFWQTDFWALFYSQEDPRAWLMPDEIDAVAPAKVIALDRRVSIMLSRVAA